MCAKVRGKLLIRNQRVVLQPRLMHRHQRIDVGIKKHKFSTIFDRIGLSGKNASKRRWVSHSCHWSQISRYQRRLWWKSMLNQFYNFAWCVSSLPAPPSVTSLTLRQVVSIRCALEVWFLNGKLSLYQLGCQILWSWRTTNPNWQCEYNENRKNTAIECHLIS